MQRVALASTDLAAHVHDGVSHSAAHKFLTHMRDTHGATMWQQDLHDLTDSNEFNWRSYLANRPGTQALLRDAHVWQFAFVWTRAWDSNRKQQRGDFLLRLTDGRDYRLHPQSRKNRNGAHEAHPVECPKGWEHWALNSPPDGSEIGPMGVLVPLQDQTAWAPPGGGSQPVSWTSTYKGGSQADMVSPFTAQNWLAHVVSEWYRRPHPRGAFRREITDGREFDWHSFLFGQKAFADEFREGDQVERVEVAWVEELKQAALIVKRSDGWFMTATQKGWRWGDRGEAF